MRTEDELNSLKNEVKELNSKSAELNEDALVQVAGGAEPSEAPFPVKGPSLYEEYGPEWTIEAKQREEEFIVKNAEEYNINYMIVSKGE